MSVADTVQHHNVSHRGYEASSGTDDDVFTDEEYGRQAHSPSSRSSVSSIPLSIAPDIFHSGSNAATPTKSSRVYQPTSHTLNIDHGQQGYRTSPFRHASSVRRMQMRDEDDYEGHTRHSSRGTRNGSPRSARSIRPVSGFKGRNGRDYLSPPSAKVKKEFPLVLLHCSLLPPALPLRTRPLDAALLQAVLPDEYWRKWELLNDKITNDGEIQSRGVLIPHPKGDYELLEEKLLESLELVKPKLRSGHYYGIEEVSESEESESEGADKQGTKCADCGNRVVEDLGRDRTWEVKVFAANGLMRGGAWGAAWKEMEKVDIEVTLSLPEEVRADVEQKCLDLGIGPEFRGSQQAPEADDRQREIYGEHGDSPKPDRLEDFGAPHNARIDEHFSQHADVRHTSSQPSVDHYQIVLNWIRDFVQDKRNFAIAVLTMAVLFFAVGQSAMASSGQASKATATTQSAIPAMSSSLSSATSAAPLSTSSSVRCIMERSTTDTATQEASTESPKPLSSRIHEEDPAEADTVQEPAEAAFSGTVAPPMQRPLVEQGNPRDIEETTEAA